MKSFKNNFLRNLPFLFFVALLTFSGTSFSSCTPKVGCKINDGSANTNRKGELSSKRGKTNLLPKKHRKKYN